MAVTPTVTNKIGMEDGSLALYTWVLTTAEPIGLPINYAGEWADKTWSIGDGGSDNFGGATCSIRGGNIAGKMNTLSNAAGGAAASATSAKTLTTIENPLLMAPELTVTGTDAEVTVSVLVRRPNPMRQ